jgi:hypothetical protein
MIRVPVLFTCLFLLAGTAIADEMNITDNTTQMGDQNLTNLAFSDNTTEVLNLTVIGESNSANITPGENLTSSEKAVDKPAKPVYKLSIGSVYSADYKEPEPMTFTSSGCGA